MNIRSANEGTVFYDSFKRGNRHKNHERAEICQHYKHSSVLGQLCGVCWSAEFMSSQQRRDFITMEYAGLLSS